MLTPDSVIPLLPPVFSLDPYRLVIVVRDSLIIVFYHLPSNARRRPSDVECRRRTILLLLTEERVCTIYHHCWLLLYDCTICIRNTLSHSKLWVSATVFGEFWKDGDCCKSLTIFEVAFRNDLPPLFTNRAALAYKAVRERGEISGSLRRIPF